MRRSKYLGKKFENWTCTHVGIASVQPAKNKFRGHRNYYYIFERPTSDGKAFKMLRLNGSAASKVYKGLLSIEDIVKIRKKNQKFTQKISYNFIDRL